MDDGNLRTTRELEVYYPSNNATTNNGAPAIISKDESNLASNTRALKRQKLLSAVDVFGGCPTAKKSASISYLLQLLADFAGAVLEKETGKLLKYFHLIKRPK